MKYGALKVNFFAYKLQKLSQSLLSYTLQEINRGYSSKIMTKYFAVWRLSCDTKIVEEKYLLPSITLQF